MFDIKVDFSSADTLLSGLGLEERGRVQRFFTDDVMRRADKYVPFESGVLKNSAQVVDNGTAITYTTPYARYLYYGKLYVDPIYLIGAFHDPVTGRFWSRPGVKKIPTNKDLQYNEAPERGSHWVERMWQAEGNIIIDEVTRYITKKG